MTINEQIIRDVLARTIGEQPVSYAGVTVRDGRVGFLLTVDPSDKALGMAMREACEVAIKQLAGVENVTAVLTAHSPALVAGLGHSKNQTPPSGGDKAKAQWNMTPVAGVKQVIAVASGKGGVGKSTTTINLAHALAVAGKKVGILDADIYGPSIPTMLGVPNTQPPVVNNKMQPAMAHGIVMMSIALITGDEAAILRGPMISKALTQMLRFTDWGDLDVFLVDMPPGTGDIHLSMVQQVPLSGVIIVTMPQTVATIDAAKCMKMFEKVNVPVLAVLENMSGDMFGEGGGKQLAAQFNVPYAGSVRLDSAIRKTNDSAEKPDTTILAQYQPVIDLLKL
jgi:ATP-binding protein involved in chromosome partitioning